MTINLKSKTLNPEPSIIATGPSLPHDSPKVNILTDLHKNHGFSEPPQAPGLGLGCSDLSLGASGLGMQE